MSYNVFSHKKLYVVLSCSIVQSPTKVWVHKRNFEGITSIHSQNVVYKIFCYLAQLAVQFYSIKDVVVHLNFL